MMHTYLAQLGAKAGYLPVMVSVNSCSLVTLQLIVWMLPKLTAAVESVLSYRQSYRGGECHTCKSIMTNILPLGMSDSINSSNIVI